RLQVAGSFSPQPNDGGQDSNLYGVIDNAAQTTFTLGSWYAQNGNVTKHLNGVSGTGMLVGYQTNNAWSGWFDASANPAGTYFGQVKMQAMDTWGAYNNIYAQVVFYTSGYPFMAPASFINTSADQTFIATPVVTGVGNKYITSNGYHAYRFSQSYSGA